MPTIDEEILRLRTKYIKENNLVLIRAIVGDASGNVPADIPGWVWVRIQSSNGLFDKRRVLPPAGKAMSLKAGAAVTLEYDKMDNLRIAEPDTQSDLAGGVNVLAQVVQPTSAATPRLSQGSLETLRVIPTNPASLFVAVKAWNVIVNGIEYQFPGALVDLTSYVPSAGNMRYACPFVKSDYATTEVFASTARSTADVPLSSADIQECITAATAGSTPVWALKLVSGQTAITQDNIDIDGVDLRQMVNTAAGSGTGNVSGPGTSTDRAVATWNGTGGTTLRDNANNTIDASGNASDVSEKITGTGGNGFVEIVAQASNPAAPGATGLRAFATAVGMLAWRIKNGADTYARAFIGALTADRNYTLPDYDGTLATLTGSENLTNKTLTTPTIASFTNATHSHQNSTGGGTLDGAAIAAGTVAAARLGVMTGDGGSGGAKGAVPAPATGDATKFLKGDGTWATPSGTGVTGPGSSTDTAIARWNGIGGTTLQDSGITIDGSNNMTIPGRLITQSGRNIKVRVVTASGAVTVATSDYVVVVNKTTGAATTVNLPSSPSTGDTYSIKDGKGDAATNNLTLTPASGNIDGAATFVMKVNYESITVVYNGTQWNII